MKRGIYWFRDDLRLRDNPGLIEAVKHGLVLPVYILDSQASPKLGEASRCWLHHALLSLNDDLNQHLLVMQGAPADVLLQLVTKHNIHAVFWNKRYTQAAIKQDAEIEQALRAKQVTVQVEAGNLLWEPRRILNQAQKPYRVFTPYYKKGCLNAAAPELPKSKPTGIQYIKVDAKPIESLKLLPQKTWHTSMLSEWQIGEKAAQKVLAEFIESGLQQYAEGRNHPAIPAVSRLSPYLQFGQISIRDVWHAVIKQKHTNHVETFLSELGWREFSHYLLYHFPDLPKKNFNAKFDAFPWTKDKARLKAWQQGMTGYPLVDAGMRELWQTGYMHNRIRMVTASFLVKNLLIHWYEGEQWFWDCLLDASLASNSASWQWVAGSGADAAPYFRIFNPVTQGEKFDAEGAYVKQYIPELKHLPIKYLFAPWNAPKAVLEEASIVLGQDYPKPIVDLAYSRQRALEAYQIIRSS